MNKAKKLYFNVDLEAVSSTRRTFPLTVGRAGFATGDLFGALLDTFPPSGRIGDANQRRRNMVAAWFEPIGEDLTADATRSVVVEFVAWTAAGRTAQAGMGFTGGPAAGELSGATLPGGVPVYTGSPVAALFTKNFAVRVRTPDSTRGLKGILYVERKHSIEV